MPEVRPQRWCAECYQTDDHPRHIAGDGSLRHIDCCAALGCPICRESEAFVAEHAGEALRGQDLIDYYAEWRLIRAASDGEG